MKLFGCLFVSLENEVHLVETYLPGVILCSNVP